MSPGNPKQNGHIFDFDEHPCKRCGMTKSYYYDKGEPACTGQKFEPPPKAGPSTHRKFARGDCE